LCIRARAGDVSPAPVRDAEDIAMATKIVKTPTALAALLVCLGCAATLLASDPDFAAAAELTFHEMETPGGNIIEYGLLRPAKFDPDRKYRVILALPPGGQDMPMVRLGVRGWLPYLAEREWIVVSPAAPAGRLYFAGGERVLPAFMDHVLENFPVDGEKFFLVGISNGGISAFRAAVLYPNRFRSVTVLPGYPTGADMDRLDRIKDLPVTMIVGGRDSGWLEKSQAAHAKLVSLGGNVRLEILPGENHFLHERYPVDKVVDAMTRR
jgi:pimeloyl-ACP methyl ester carboxylesterase